MIGGVRLGIAVLVGWAGAWLWAYGAVLQPHPGPAATPGAGPPGPEGGRHPALAGHAWLSCSSGRRPAVAGHD